jgi:hypothetical protein
MLVGFFAHPYLPNVIPTHFDKSGNPDRFGEKGELSFAFPLIMLALFVLIFSFDIFLICPTFPGKILASANWGLQGVLAITYLSAIFYSLTIIDNFLIGFFSGFFILSIIFYTLYKKAVEKIDGVANEALDEPYLERVRLTFPYNLLFLYIPYFPRYLILSPAGLRILGVLYDVTYGWGEIATVEPISVKVGRFWFSLRINSDFSNMMALTLHGRKLKVIISSKNRERFIKTARSFMAKRG